MTQHQRRITPEDLVPLINEMCSLSRRHLDIWRICIQAGSVLFRSQDVARIAAVSRCHPRTVQRAIRAIRARPRLAAAITWIGYPAAQSPDVDGTSLYGRSHPRGRIEADEDIEEDSP